MNETPPKKTWLGLFANSRPLDRTLHRNLKINRMAGYRFASHEFAAPITAIEFSSAARDYPIIFAGDNQAPMIVLGLRSGRNLLVDEQGKWQEGKYIPAHLRRYPFVFMEDGAKTRFTLCIDEKAEHFQDQNSASEPLFINGDPAPFVTDMLNFLSAFHNDNLATQQFSAALQNAGLLIERRAEVEMANGEHLALTRFNVIDETRFNKLPAETFLEWRKRGWLPLVYFHLLSLANWNRLLDLAAKPS